MNNRNRAGVIAAIIGIIWRCLTQAHRRLSSIGR